MRIFFPQIFADQVGENLREKRDDSFFKVVTPFLQPSGRKLIIERSSLNL